MPKLTAMLKESDIAEGHKIAVTCYVDGRNLIDLYPESRRQAQDFVRKQAGRTGYVIDPEPGKSYEGQIMALYGDTALQKVDAGTYVLHPIRAVSGMQVDGSSGQEVKIEYDAAGQVRTVVPGEHKIENWDGTPCPEIGQKVAFQAFGGMAKLIGEVVNVDETMITLRTGTREIPVYRDKGSFVPILPDIANVRVSERSDTQGNGGFER